MLQRAYIGVANPHDGEGVLSHMSQPSQPNVTNEFTYSLGIFFAFSNFKHCVTQGSSNCYFL